MCGLILVQYPYVGRVEISIDEPQFRWIREHGTLHVPDVRSAERFSNVGFRSGCRTFLVVPLRQQGELIGTLVARRIEVRPFTPAQIKLLETFADQAVIAIENVRLFKELGSATRNCARPWSIRPRQPRCSASSAARRLTCSRCSMLSSRAPHGCAGSMTWYCDLVKGQLPVRRLISVQFPQACRNQYRRATVSLGARARNASRSRCPQAETISRVGDVRQLRHAVLCVPLRQQGERIGVVNSTSNRGASLHRPAQIKLLETFADQAVIAIENVRLVQRTPERNAISRAWSSRPRPVRFWKSSPARRRTFSQFWTSLRRTPHELCDSSDA